MSIVINANVDTLKLQIIRYPTEGPPNLWRGYLFTGRRIVIVIIIITAAAIVSIINSISNGKQERFQKPEVSSGLAGSFQIGLSN